MIGKLSHSTFSGWPGLLQLREGAEKEGTGGELTVGGPGPEPLRVRVSRSHRAYSSWFGEWPDWRDLLSGACAGISSPSSSFFSEPMRAGSSASMAFLALPSPSPDCHHGGKWDIMVFVLTVELAFERRIGDSNLVSTKPRPLIPTLLIV